MLGKDEGKVISFEDIEEARAKRTTKEAIKGKGRRGRKCKSAALEVAEAAESQPEPEVARAAREAIKEGRGKRRSTAQEADEPEPAEPEPEVTRITDTPVSWRVPITRII